MIFESSSAGTYEHPARHGADTVDPDPTGETACRCGQTAAHAAMRDHFRDTFDPDADDLPAVQFGHTGTGDVFWTYLCGIEDCCPDWPRGSLT